MTDETLIRSGIAYACNMVRYKICISAKISPSAEYLPSGKNSGRMADDAVWKCARTVWFMGRDGIGAGA
ncbi:MAG: hypothetical protein A2Z46_03110 [Nitrospirae bacterium RBG_19FT_COMBO_55_12]|nr:MAG: hypothetical protein A2Z46_03110 [Nitrospirae bacterium RBG_19FT_COMBO_55_12]